MKQAQVTTWGQPPKCLEVPVPGPPPSGQVQVKVLAAGLHNLVRARASGAHYSAKLLPHIPGVDGVGTTPDGKLVYFAVLAPTGGSFTDVVNVPVAAAAPLPDGADPIQVAGLFNPVMASWMALAARTSGLQPGFTAVIVGATGLSGASAVGVARTFGAGRVVGIARSAAKMSGLGLDATVELRDDITETDYSAALDADVILDFLYGPPVLGLLQALKPTKPVQYIQIGAVVERTMNLPGDLLRSKDITVRGAGIGSWPMKLFAQESPKMIAAIASGKIKPYQFDEVQLHDIEAVWERKGGDRIVIVP